ncbi:Uncharacterised protein [Zhongshania aliphaticivorans]|uniref:DUF547 domain-containing protein n=2 Tax=Zhongshania aliphaticivorans TaxID=1470434 RepID=A0A5S9Q501_9GAMM|nr:Uncharacterised protein [Zhongshania aliphaticivorans]CAA0112752.1 Uncharacterised protein [Zhongshania aliphaticivorans]
MAILAANSSFANTFSHTPWATILQQHVEMVRDGRESRVDYAGIKKDRLLLLTYLTDMSKVTKKSFDSWPKMQQLAFLINAYNAWTVELILSRYPDIDSIKDLGSFFTSPWKKEFVNLLGEVRSLDDIEHNLIRGSGRYNEPRIHFAVNCASIGCPALLNDAYAGDKLDEQLAAVTENFLRDRNRHYFANGELHISPIFKWYKADFEQGWNGVHSVSQFLAAYADALGLQDSGSGIIVNGKLVSERLSEDSIGISYTDYNWDLNDVAR